MVFKHAAMCENLMECLVLLSLILLLLLNIY